MSTVHSIKRALKSLVGDSGVKFIQRQKSLMAERGDRRDQTKVARWNRRQGYSYADIGGGSALPPRGWWVGDKVSGTIFDANSNLPFVDGSMDLIYSSMFFEHIDDATAANLMREVARTLKPCGIFRLAVPNFWLWMDKYRTGDIDYFLELQKGNPDLKTWAQMGVPIDIEHLLAWHVAAIHNKPHTLTPYPHREDHSASPPVFTYPHHDKLDGYYCGPAPELTTEAIRENFASKNPTDFLEWIFSVTNASKHQDPTFNSWHKNWWDREKIIRMGFETGLGRVVKSEFGASKIPIPESIEKPGHAAYGLYFEMRKDHGHGKKWDY